MTDPRPSRRTLLLGLGAAALLPAARTRAATAPPAHFPRQDPELVRQVVGASHFDLDRVKELVEARPELAKASWDWGFGDWETPLGAASHTGRREIAELLLAHGARPTVFSAAMLGQVAVVRAFVEARPGVQSIPGPHGIPLLDHARVGGEAAAPVVAYLQEVGGADGGPVSELSEEARQPYLGTYAWGEGDGGRLEVSLDRRGRLSLRIADGTARPLIHLDGHTFHPAGAPSVLVEFETEGGKVVATTVRDGELDLVARRR